MKRRFFSLLILSIVLLGIAVQPVSAQTYSFSVPVQDVHLYVNEDGTVSLDYTIQFANDPGVSPIDYVDVGMPSENYDMGSITASVDGHPITDISASPYVSPGIALGLGGYAIPAGGSGVVQVHVGTITGLLHPGTEKEAEDYAAFQFAPNYFSSDFANGSTDMTVTLHLPPGLLPEEPRYFTPKGWPGDAIPAGGYDSENRVTYTWQSSNANPYTEYTFGASFPARLVPASSIVAAPVFNISTETICCAGFAIFFLVVIGLVIYGITVSQKQRKMAYLPPRIAIEGHGIKRGLTAVEAAILMETPLDRIMTMMLFSTVKKNAAAVTSRDPLTIEVSSPLPDTLQPYEIDFLRAMQEKNKTVQTRALQDIMVGLVKGVSEKMKGFSRKETIEYYRDIIKRAWEQVDAADTPDVKVEKFDEYMGWTMLDRDFDTRTQRTFTGGPIYVPIWWGRFDPAVGQGIKTGSLTPSTSGSGRSISLPTLPGAGFAASMVTGAQDFASRIVGNLTSFTEGITNKTNPPPPPSKGTWTSGGGGGGGHSCACACACAGCACACAGGGR